MNEAGFPEVGNVEIVRHIAVRCIPARVTASEERKNRQTGPFAGKKQSNGWLRDVQNFHGGSTGFNKLDMLGR